MGMRRGTPTPFSYIAKQSDKRTSEMITLTKKERKPLMTSTKLKRDDHTDKERKEASHDKHKAQAR